MATKAKKTKYQVIVDGHIYREFSELKKAEMVAQVNNGDVYKDMHMYESFETIMLKNPPLKAPDPLEEYREVLDKKKEEKTPEEEKPLLASEKEMDFYVTVQIQCLLNVRERPSTTNSKILAVLEPGNIYMTHDWSNGFYKIMYKPGKFGWCLCDKRTMKIIKD